MPGTKNFYAGLLVEKSTVEDSGGGEASIGFDEEASLVSPLHNVYIGQ